MVAKYPSNRGELNVELDQEIVENARVATGARIVHLYRFDSETNKAVRVASSALTSARIRRSLEQIRRIFPGFHPGNVHPDVTVNPLMKRVYLDGRPVHASLEEIAEGVVHPRIITIAKALIRIGHVVSCPLISNGRVFAALTFHLKQPMSRAQQATCEAFVRQVVLTMENARLLSESQHHVEELRHSRSLLSEAEEQLRRKVAEFMHGRVQSHLLVAWHRLDEAKNLVFKDPEAAVSLIEESRQIIDRVREHDVRNVSHLLHPSIIQVGLVPALRSLASTYGDRIRITLDVDATVREWDHPVQNRIPERARLAAYRVVEEALSNTYRHGKASRADVTVRAEGSILEVRVIDDGCGLDPGAVQMGLGLASIDARVSQLEGTWSLRNNGETGGVVLTARLPLTLAETAATSTRRRLA